MKLVYRIGLLLAMVGNFVALALVGYGVTAPLPPMVGLHLILFILSGIFNYVLMIEEI